MNFFSTTSIGSDYFSWQTRKLLRCYLFWASGWMLLYDTEQCISIKLLTVVSATVATGLQHAQMPQHSNDQSATVKPSNVRNFSE